MPEYRPDIEHWMREEQKRWPHINEDVLEQNARLRRRTAWYAQQHQRLIELAGDNAIYRNLGRDFRTGGQAQLRIDANDLWRDHCERLGPQQGLRQLRTLLISHGLVDRSKAMAIEIIWQDPEARKEAMEAERHHQQLQDAIQQILEAVGRTPGHHQDALAFYNSNAHRLDWSKLNNWCRQLVGAKLLGPQWMTGVRGGSLFDKLKAKLVG